MTKFVMFLAYMGEDYIRVLHNGNVLDFKLRGENLYRLDTNDVYVTETCGGLFRLEVGRKNLSGPLPPDAVFYTSVESLNTVTASQLLNRLLDNSAKYEKLTKTSGTNADFIKHFSTSQHLFDEAMLVDAYIKTGEISRIRRIAENWGLTLAED